MPTLFRILAATILLCATSLADAEVVKLKHPVRVKFRPTKEGKVLFQGNHRTPPNQYIFRTVAGCDQTRVGFTDGNIVPWQSLQPHSVAQLICRIYAVNRSLDILQMGVAVLDGLSEGSGITEGRLLKRYHDEEAQRVARLPKTLHYHEVKRPTPIAFDLTEEAAERYELDETARSGSLFLLGYDEAGPTIMGRNGYVWCFNWNDIKTEGIVASSRFSRAAGIFLPLLQYEGTIENWRFVDSILQQLPDNEGQRALVAQQIALIQSGKQPKRPAPPENPADVFRVLLIFEESFERKESPKVTPWLDQLRTMRKDLKLHKTNFHDFRDAITDYNIHDFDLIMFSMGGWASPGNNRPKYTLAAQDKHSWRDLAEGQEARVQYAQMLWPRAKIALVTQPKIMVEKADHNVNFIKNDLANFHFNCSQGQPWFNAQCRKIAEKHGCLFADCYEVVGEENYVDYFQLNERGHAQFADSIWQQLGLEDFES